MMYLEESIWKIEDCQGDEVLVIRDVNIVRKVVQLTRTVSSVYQVIDAKRAHLGISYTCSIQETEKV